jgi:hypothetical protein
MLQDDLGYLAGAVYVTEACQVYLRGQSCAISLFPPCIRSLSGHLRGTEWGSNEAIERAVQHFERNAKRKVKNLWTLAGSSALMYAPV